MNPFASTVRSLRSYHITAAVCPPPQRTPAQGPQRHSGGASAHCALRERAAGGADVSVTPLSSDDVGRDLSIAADPAFLERSLALGQRRHRPTGDALGILPHCAAALCLPQPQPLPTPFRRGNRAPGPL